MDKPLLYRQHGSRLLSLPDELQLEIYKEVFGSFNLWAAFKEFRSTERVTVFQMNYMEYSTEFTDSFKRSHCLDDAVLYVCKQVNGIAREAREKSFSGRLSFYGIHSAPLAFTACERMMSSSASHAALLSNVTKLNIHHLLGLRIGSPIVKTTFIGAAKVFPRLRSIEINDEPSPRHWSGFKRRSNEAGFEDRWNKGEEDDVFLEALTEKLERLWMENLRNRAGDTIDVFVDLRIPVSFVKEIKVFTIRVHITAENSRVIQRYFGPHREYKPNG